MEWVPRWSVWLGAEAIKDGERAPWYLGYAWYLPYSDRTLFLPMPVNWIASWSTNDVDSVPSNQTERRHAQSLSVCAQSRL